MSSSGTISVDYPTLLDDLRVGDRLILGDGAISLRMVSVGADEAAALIETGGRTQGRPGVHLPSERTRLASPTDEDLVLAERMAAVGVEFIAVSFVRAAADMREGPRRRRRPGRARRQDRDHHGARQPGRDPR